MTPGKILLRIIFPYVAGAVSLIGFLRPYILYRRRFPAAQWSTRGAPYRR